MCVYLTIGNGWGCSEMDNQAFYGLKGYKEALSKFEEAIDSGKYATLRVMGRD